MTKRISSGHSPLSQQYPHEYNCWKAMKQRVARNGHKLHPRFQTFDHFLEFVGKAPNPEDTLDRIDHKNPEYSPKNVRWASKSLQTRNRKNTTFLEYTGRKYPDKRGVKLSLADWADVSGQNASTMRGRKKAGWTANEIIDGERARQPKTFEQMSLPELLDHKPWDQEEADAQEQSYLHGSKEHETRFEFMLSAVRRGQLNRLRKQHKSTAFYMHDERERDEYERIFRTFDAVEYDTWGRKRGASQADWKRLLTDYTSHLAKFKKLATQAARWENAVKAFNAARTNSEAAGRKRRELVERYGLLRRPKSPERHEDEDD